MSTQELIDYIKHCISVGQTNEQIKNTLLQNGWQNNDIDQAFASINPKIPPIPTISSQNTNTIGFNNDIIKSNKNYKSKVLIIVLIILVLAIIGFLVYKNIFPKSKITQNQEQNSEVNTQQPLNSEQSNTQATNLKTYTSKNKIFSVSYPADWSKVENQAISGTDNKVVIPGSVVLKSYTMEQLDQAIRDNVAKDMNSGTKTELSFPEAEFTIMEPMVLPGADMNKEWKGMKDSLSENDKITGEKSEIIIFNGYEAIKSTKSEKRNGGLTTISNTYTVYFKGNILTISSSYDNEELGKKVDEIIKSVKFY